MLTKTAFLAGYRVGDMVVATGDGAGLLVITANDGKTVTHATVAWKD